MDTSIDRDPLGYIHGIGALIPGLEKELEGKGQGDKVLAIIPPAEAYGEWQEQMQQVVSKEGFQGNEELTTGVRVQVDTGQGTSIAVVTKIEDEAVTLDFNHPLAGQTLHFDVEILEVRNASAEELDHGHVHGRGGHHH